MKKYRNRQKLLRLAGFAVLAIVAVLFAVPSFGFSLVALVAPKLAFAIFGAGSKGIYFAALPFAMVLRKADGEDGGNTALLEKIEKGVTALKTDVDEMKKNSVEVILGDQSRWPKDFKTAMEDLTKLKNTANDQHANMEGFQRKLEEVDRILRVHARGAFGDPIERIIANEEMRARINIAVRMAMNGSDNDMLRLIKSKFDKTMVKRALGEDSSPGSTLINQQLANEIYDTLALYGAWNTLGVRRLGTKTTVYPVKTARPTANFVLTEGNTISDDTDKAGTSVSLEVEVIAVLLNVSLQLLQDEEFDVTADVLDDFREAFNFRLDYAAFSADGTSDATNGGMTGLFNYGTAAPAAAGNTLTGNTQLEDWVRCITTVDVGVLNRACAWWMHPQILARAILVRDKNGRSIFQTALEAPSMGAVGSILGSPVNRVSAAPSTDSASAKIATFGEKNGYVVGIRQDFTFEGSDHHKWNTLQRSFRGYGRAGTKGRRATAFAVLTLPAA